MAQPTPYDRQFSFQGFQASQPTTPLPGDEVDGELNAVKLTIDQTLVNLAKIQRDDGALKNGIVTQESLSPSLSIGFTFRGTWASGVNYLLSDGVSVGSIFYKAKSSHLSDGTNQPPNATYWDSVADITPLAIGPNSVSEAAIQAGAVTAAKLGPLAVATAKLADEAVTEAKIGPLAVATAKLADEAVTEAKIGPLAVTEAKIEANAVTNAKLAQVATQTLKGRATAGTGNTEDLTPAQARAVIGDGWFLPVGMLVPFGGSTAPSLWLLAYGQAVSRTTYSALFAVFGTTYGVGDGSTTFNLPDLRGRAVAGKDNMGGSAANRLTGLSGGVAGATLGATGGGETHTLTLAQMPAHNHTTGVPDPYNGAAANVGAGTQGTTTSNRTSDSKGGDQAHNNVQPTLILNYIVFAGS